MATSRQGKPKQRKRRYKTASQIDAANRRAFQEAAWKQRVCQVCGKGGPWQAHHVTEKQKLRIEFRMDVVWDTRNAMRICDECHSGQTYGHRRIDLNRLSDSHYEFAFDILGISAYNYLRRKYNGKDSRLETYLEQAQKKKGDDARTAAAGS